jgi:hypothetical protein
MRIKEIEGCPLYFISDFGIVYTMRPKGRISGCVNPRVVKGSSNNGYVKVTIDGKTYSVHRLVAKAFLGDSPAEVNHKDGNRSNNYYKNLEYCTHDYNMKHGAARRAQEKINLPKDKLDDIEYYLLGSKLMMHEIAEELGVSLPIVKKVNRSLAKI